jgi:hypothetical protein
MNGGWQSKSSNNQFLNLELTASIAVDHLFELLDHKINERFKI